MPDNNFFPEFEENDTTNVEFQYDEDGVPIAEIVTTFDEEGDMVSQSTFEFTEYGNLLQETQYFDADGVFSITTTEFNNDGLPLVTTEYDPIDESERSVVRDYDASGREINTQTYYDGELAYDTDRIYDENGNEVRVEIHNGDGNLQNVITKEYDSSGNIEKETNQQVYSFNGEFVTHETFYNQDGEVIKEVNTISDGENNQLVTTNEYDQEGRVEKITFEREDGSVDEKHFDYDNMKIETVEYDKDGNDLREESIELSSSDISNDSIDDISADFYPDIDDGFDNDDFDSNDFDKD